MTALPAELRARPRTLHAALDASLPLTDPRLTREQYVAFLSAMLSWLRPTERARTLEITATRGGGYFVGDGTATGTRWRRVCSALDAYASADRSAIADGAQRTFASLLDWMNHRSAGRHGTRGQGI